MTSTWDQALAWESFAGTCWHPVGAGSVAEVVRQLGAVPGYPDATPVPQSASARAGTLGGRRSALALDAGEIFKSYAFRGATHLLTPRRAARIWR